MSDVRLIHGDCLDVLRSLPEGSVDAVVTDPPYNVGLDYASTDDLRPDYEPWCAAWFSGLRRICSGAIAINVGVANLAMWCRIAPPDWWMAWTKMDGRGRCHVGFNRWEPIAVYGKPPKQIADVIPANIQPLDPECSHPCPKPSRWGERLVAAMSVEGCTVLDPFMGSGTTGVACVNTGRNFIGVEISEEYFKIAERRIADAQVKQSELLIA